MDANFLRDVTAFENAVNLLASARHAFEGNPSATNDLASVQTAVDAAQAKLEILKPYVVEVNQQTTDLWARVKRAYESGTLLAAIDDIDRLRQEYIQYKFSVVPARPSFQKIGAPWNWGDYGYAIISAAVQTSAGKIVASGTSITSAYRNPRKEISPPINGKVNSRHCYGDAVDFAASDKASFLKVAKAACAEGPSWLEPARMSSYNHVHADWRPGGVVVSTYCNTPQIPTGFNAVASGSTQIRISWNDHLPSSLDGIKIYRSTNGTEFVEIADVNHGVQTYIDNEMAGGTYYYRACAYNDLAGSSGFTGAIAVTLPNQLNRTA